MKLNFKVLAPFIVLFGVLVFLEPRSPKWGYDYKKGSPWSYETLVAQFDFPILKTQAQMDAELADAKNGAVPYFKVNRESTLESLEDVRSAKFGKYEYLHYLVNRSFADIYSKGVLPDESTILDRSSEGLLYIQRDKRAEKTPYTEVYDLTGAKAALLASVSSEHKNLKADSLLNALGIYALLRANLEFDEQTTLLVNSQKNVTISPTLGYVSAGQLIVLKDEIVTSEIAQMLDSYKTEYENNIGFGGLRVALWAGNILIALAIVVALFFAVFFSKTIIYEKYSRFLFVMTVELIQSVAALVIIGMNETYLFIFPFTIGALYLQAFFKAKIIFPLYIVSLLPLLVFSQSGSMLFLIFLVGGIVQLYRFKFFGRGARQFICALITFGTELVIFFAFTFAGMASYNIATVLMLLFFNSIFTVAFYPFIFLFERIFGLVSRSRLMELSDTSNELLRRLEQSAPGTFQHSLQVMNIATAAARAIKADESLMRVGALYHDVGKLVNPQCFVENESLSSHDSGATYHSVLSPLQSAQDILKHVPDGMELAKEYRLPEEVTNFILTHHGDNFVPFFYDKFLKDGGDPAMRSEFCYKGVKPFIREHVILMLADSIEAASRTLPDHSYESVSKLVENITASKIEDGQLENSNITMKELVIVKEVFKDHILQIYHERVKYPKRK